MFIFLECPDFSKAVKFGMLKIKTCFLFPHSCLVQAMATAEHPPTVAGFSMQDLQARLKENVLPADVATRLLERMKAEAAQSMAIHVGRNLGKNTCLEIQIAGSYKIARTCR